MEQVAQQLADLVEFPIGYEGQRRAHRVVHTAMPVGAAAAFVAGFATGEFWVVWAVFGAVVAVAAVAVLPPWGGYSQGLLTWLGNEGVGISW